MVAPRPENVSFAPLAPRSNADPFCLLRPSPTGPRRYYFDRSDEEAEEEEKEEGGAAPLSYHSRYRYGGHVRDGDREDVLYEDTLYETTS